MIRIKYNNLVRLVNVKIEMTFEINVYELSKLSYDF